MFKYSIMQALKWRSLTFKWVLQFPEYLSTTTTATTKHISNKISQKHFMKLHLSLTSKWSLADLSSYFCCLCNTLTSGSWKYGCIHVRKSLIRAALPYWAYLLVVLLSALLESQQSSLLFFWFGTNIWLQFCLLLFSNPCISFSCIINFISQNIH